MTHTLVASHIFNGRLRIEALVIIAWAVTVVVALVVAHFYGNHRHRAGAYAAAKKISDDIRLFRDHRCGRMIGSANFVLLTEASAIASHHGRDPDAPIEGISRFRARDTPRSHAARRIAWRREIRNRGTFPPVDSVTAEQEGTIEVASAAWWDTDGARGGRL